MEGEDGASESGDGSSESQETTEVQVSPHITNDKLTSYDALESTLTSDEVFGGSLFMDKEKAMVKNLQDHYGEEFGFAVQDEWGSNDIVVATTGDPATATKRNGRRFEIDTGNKSYKSNPERYLQRFHGWAEQKRKDNMLLSETGDMKNKDADVATNQIAKISGQAPTRDNDAEIKAQQKIIDNAVGPSQAKADAEAKLEVLHDEKDKKEFTNNPKENIELADKYNEGLKKELDSERERLKIGGVKEGSKEWNDALTKARESYNKNKFGKGQLAQIERWQGVADNDGNLKNETADVKSTAANIVHAVTGHQQKNLLGKTKNNEKDIRAAAIANLKKDTLKGYSGAFEGEEGENTFDWLAPEDEWMLLDGMSFAEIEQLAGMRLDGDDASLYGIDTKKATLWNSKKKKQQVDSIRYKLSKQEAREATKKLRVLEDELQVVASERKDLDGVRADLDVRAEKWKTGGLVELENLSKEIDEFPQPTTQEELVKYEDLVNQYNTLREEGLTLQSDSDNYNSSLTAFNEKTKSFSDRIDNAEAIKSKAIGKYGFEVVDGLMKDNSTNFQSIKNYEKWRKEHKITHSFFDKDAWAVLGSGLANTAGKYFTGTSLWALNGLDAVTGANTAGGTESFSRLDALNSMYETYTDYDYFGRAEAGDYEGGEGPTGILNKGATAIAEGLPFMLAIAASSGREGFKPGFWTRTLGKPRVC